MNRDSVEALEQWGDVFPAPSPAQVVYVAHLKLGLDVQLQLEGNTVVHSGGDEFWRRIRVGRFLPERKGIIYWQTESSKSHSFLRVVLGGQGVIRTPE